VKGILVKDAAKIVGVSDRHWGRYESGATSFPLARIPALAKAIQLPEGRVLMKAGYEETDGEISPEVELRLIWQDLREGNLFAAARTLVSLHYRLEQREKTPLRPPSQSIINGDYLTAMLAIYNLPAWLCDDLIEHLKMRRDRGEGSDCPLTPEKRAELLERIELPWAINRLRSNKGDKQR
jgi:transcriptional regulator with XRE-family HTH domain